MTLRLPHNAALGGSLALTSINPFVPPVRIAAHDTAAGWGLFELSLARVEDAEIDEYDVRFTDAHGLWIEQPLGLLREVADEATLSHD